MSLIVGEEDLMEVVSPFNCVASSIDGQYGEQLTDDKGCGVEWSPMRILNAADNSFAVYSALIHLPSFLKASVLQVSCEFYLCPLHGPSPCLRRCGDPIRRLKGRVRRESESPKSSNSSTATTIITTTTIIINKNRRTKNKSALLPFGFFLASAMSRKQERQEQTWRPMSKTSGPSQ
ncbi:uncharacterized protein LOC112574449 [Pomacea canaliculata]|uniref:uncharacterized protein LOC112574449 n=1 Tax=Pomacea canaliculata TaxID=400727 RepID=UPI000D726706|nr:uncharacterized protein LOC112574449 [Pomacea canaliculata]XP_025111316.1 uncharacterized protein LOC112574449 [Pomacea canaliculata]